MLTERQTKILHSLIQEYITTATPVASEIIARKYNLEVSSATVRNEMGELEREGYIVQPYTSAGRVPSTKGYRSYVETVEESQLPPSEQTLIRHQFYQATKDIEEWIQLTAAILARMLHSVAIVSFPGAAEPRLKLVRLVSLEDFIALLLLVFEDRHFRQRTIFFDEPVSQESLETLSQRLTDTCSGLTISEIKARKQVLTSLEDMILNVILNMMTEDKDYALKQPYFVGISEILSQPEFVRSDKTRMLMELLEGRAILSSILSQIAHDERLRVIIGNENPESMMHDFSMVVGRYGVPDQASGTIGIVGPTRMPYDRAVSAIRFLSDTMSEMVYNLYG
ncbi:MAG: heat-inducible transcriptional repressor HrcA [Dehalococcoidia bacterium]